MALMNITVIPIGTGETSVGDYIADIEKYLRDKKIAHSLGDMGTVVYGELNELFRIAKEIHSIPFSKGVDRVVTQITIDDRHDKKRKIGDKQKAIINRLK